MFGSSWSDDSEEIGPLSHWTEDFTDDIEDGPMVPSSWKEQKKEKEEDKRIGPMASWAEENLKK